MVNISRFLWYNQRFSWGKKVRGLEFKYSAERADCNDCGDEILISQLHDRNLQKLDNAYREKAGIINVYYIKKIIE